jgi:hypothetical protein
VSVRLARHLRVDESVAEEHLQVVQSLPHGQRPRGRRRHRAFLPRETDWPTLEAELERGSAPHRLRLFDTKIQEFSLLSAMNSRVPGLSWQVRVKSTDLGLCAKSERFRGGNHGLTSAPETSQSRARIRA